jgi:hypothetical protein
MRNSVLKVGTYNSSYADDQFERASIKSQPLRGLGHTGMHDRKSFAGIATSSERLIEVSVKYDNKKQIRNSSANSTASKHSNCDASTRSFKPKSKLVPIT